VSALFLEYALGNTLLAIPLAFLAWMLGRRRRYPSLAHVAWVLVMVRLVLPPIAALPWLSVSIPLPRPTAFPAVGQHEREGRIAPAEQRGDSTCAISPLAQITDMPDQQGRSSLPPSVPASNAGGEAAADGGRQAAAGSEAKDRGASHRLASAVLSEAPPAGLAIRRAAADPRKLVRTEGPRRAARSRAGEPTPRRTRRRRAATTPGAKRKTAGRAIGSHPRS
jgi:hypothetical protein